MKKFTSMFSILLCLILVVAFTACGAKTAAPTTDQMEQDIQTYLTLYVDANAN